MGRDNLPVVINGVRYVVDESKMEWASVPVTREQVHDSGAAGEAALVQYANWKQVRSDFSHGSGQLNADISDESNSKRYNVSLGMNPSRAGRIGADRNWNTRTHPWKDLDDVDKDQSQDHDARFWLEVGPTSAAAFLVDDRTNLYAFKPNTVPAWNATRQQIWGSQASTYHGHRIRQVIPWGEGIIITPDFSTSPTVGGFWRFTFISDSGGDYQWLLNSSVLQWENLYDTFMSDGSYVFAFYNAPSEKAVVQMNPTFNGTTFQFEESSPGDTANYYYGPLDMYVDSMVRGKNAIYFWNSDVAWTEDTMDSRIWFMDIDASTGSFSGMKVAVDLKGEHVRTVSFFNDLIGVTTSKGVRLGRVADDGTITMGDLFESRNGCDNGIFYDDRFAFTFLHSPAIEDLYDSGASQYDTAHSASSIGFIDLANQYVELGASLFETGLACSHYLCIPENFRDPNDDTLARAGYPFANLRLSYPIRSLKAWSERDLANRKTRVDRLTALVYTPEFASDLDQVHLYEYELRDRIRTYNFQDIWSRWAPYTHNRPFFDTGWVSFGTIEKKVPQVLEVGISDPDYMSLYVWYRSDIEPDWVQIVSNYPLSEYFYDQIQQEWVFSSKTKVARLDLDGVNMHEQIEFRFGIAGAGNIEWWALRAAPSPQTYNVVTLPVVLAEDATWGTDQVRMKSIFSEFSALEALQTSRTQVPVEIGDGSYQAVIDGIEIRSEDVVRWGRDTDFPQTVCRVRMILLPTWADVTS